MIYNNIIKYDMGHLRIGKSISKAIKESNLPDKELAFKLGVTRNTIYLWRTKPNHYIRKNNLIKIKNHFDRDLFIGNDNIAEFSDVIDEININDMEIDEMSKELTKDTLESQNSMIKFLISTNEKSQAIIEKLEKENQKLKEDYNNICNSRQDLPTLDMTKIQCTVKICNDNPMFINVTTPYAELFGYKELQLISHSYENLVHPDDYYKLDIDPKDLPDGYNELGIWKMIKLDKTPVYINATGNIITCDNTRFFTINVELSNQKEYQKQEMKKFTGKRNPELSE